MDELVDMAIGSIQIRGTFTEQQVREIVNCKIAELQIVMEGKIEEYKALISDSTDDRVNTETIEVVQEYLDMIGDESKFQDWASV